MASSRDAELAITVADVAHPLRGNQGDLDPLLSLVGDACCVLIGTATHGTHEFQRLRAELTKRLIVEQGFGAVAVEADFWDTYRVHRFVRGAGCDVGAIDALADFRRFPAWMWRNADMLDFVGWLRAHNEGLPDAEQVAFHGLELVEDGSHAYAGEQHWSKRSPAVGRSARDELLPGDELLVAALQARGAARVQELGHAPAREPSAAWNQRTRHLAATLAGLRAHGERQQARSKVVVWAHSAQVGDARATEMSAAGQLSLGQLLRAGGDAVLIGCSTYTGTVIAASSWGGPAGRKEVRPALWGSYEDVFHRTGLPRFVLTMRELRAVTDGLDGPRLEREIGAVYTPQSERAQHYFAANLPAQFDAVVHIDRTRAVEALERSFEGHADDVVDALLSRS